MINKSLVVAVVLASGCGTAGAGGDHGEELQGIVEHDDRVLAFELPGRVVEVVVARGQTIAAGALVARLDDSLERPLRAVREAEVRAAEAQLALARAGSRREEVRGVAAELRAAEAVESRIDRTLTRQRGLLGKGVAPGAQVEDLEGQLAGARAQREAIGQKLQLARRGARTEEIDAIEARVAAARAALVQIDERLAHYTLRAPAPGVILDVTVEPGEVVGAGAAVALLADTRHPMVDVFVPQAALEGIAVGTRAEVRVDARPRPYRATVEDVGRSTEFTPRFLFSDRERPNLVVRVRLRIEDPGQTLHAGVPAFARVLAGRSGS